MISRDELAALYEQWRRLTEAEAVAIGAANWRQLEQAQLAKARLQPPISQVRERLRNELSGHFTERDAIEQQFQAVVDELIQMEQRNSDLLASQRHTATVQQEDLERTSRNLRQLHRSYAAGAPATHWQSFS